MKEFMEEYGGVIVTCMLGIMLLGLLYSLLASGGQLHRLAELFFDGIGIKMSGGRCEELDRRIWKNRSNGNYPGRIICICLESY